MKKNELNDREEALLNFLWKANIPLTLNEMIEQLGEDGWNQVTLYKTVQSLSKKGFLEVVGMEKSVKTYARKLFPTKTKGEYYSELLVENQVGMDCIVDVTSALIGASNLSPEKRDEKIISTLEGIIAELKGR